MTLRVLTVFDTRPEAMLIVRDRVKQYPADIWKKRYGDDLFNRITNPARKFILITVHRRENFGQGFVDLCSAIKTLADKHPDWDLVYPVHLNPNVQKPVYEILGNLKNVFLAEPQEYTPFVWLMDKSDLILTDSSGVQEEGSSLGKPVLVMRDEPERLEAVNAGGVMLVGTNTSKIITGIENVILDRDLYTKMSTAHNPYSDGNATIGIIGHLKSIKQ